VREPVTTALIGCGKVGATHARALAELPGSRLVAVCSRSEERAREFGETYGVPWYTDPGEMFEAQRPQAVSICTPHPSHADLIAVCARHGAHVIVEKPLAPDLAGCDRAIDACDQAGVKLAVISQRRLYPCVQRLRRAIGDGKIGGPVLASLTVLGWRDEAYYRSDAWRGRWDTEGGGVMMNQTPHQIDLLQWLMGPVDEVYGQWDNVNHPYVEIEDTAVAVVRFRSGALGSIVLSNSQRPGLYGRLHVHGSSGASVGVQTESGSPFIAGVTTRVDPPINDLWTVPGEEDLLARWQEEDRRTASEVDVMSHYHRLQIEDFLEAVRDDRPPLVDGTEGRKVLEIITAIYRSQRDGRPVRFPVSAEPGGTDYDGRLTYIPLSRRPA
jgi:UDP-N-acetyl-2-amino-2-deoxyglucuronate dehydrogenase